MRGLLRRLDMFNTQHRHYVRECRRRRTRAYNGSVLYLVQTFILFMLKR